MRSRTLLIAAALALTRVPVSIADVQSSVPMAPIPPFEKALPDKRTQAENVATFLIDLRGLVDNLGKSPSIVVAEIGTRTITRGDVADALRNLHPTDGAKPLGKLYHDAVEGLMAQRALVIRARQAGVDKDPAVRKRLANATDAILANEYLRHALVATVSDEALHQLYDQQIAGKPGPDEVHARVIVTYTPQEASDALVLLRVGEEFASVARKMSKDSSAEAGGDIGLVRQDAVAPEIGAVLFALPPGRISTFPIHAANAWFVLKSEGRIQTPTPDFAAAKPRLTQELMRAGVDAVVQKAVMGLSQKQYAMLGQNDAAKDAAVDPDAAASVSSSFTSIDRLIDDLATSPDAPVAEIGGQIITRGEVADALRALPATGAKPVATAVPDLVKGMIEQRALTIRAREEGLDKDPAVAHRIANNTEIILANEYLRHVLTPTITDAMLHDAYEHEIADQPGPLTIRARIIRSETREQALDVLSLLRVGDDFADVARKLSKDASAAAGGDLGFIRPDSVPPEINAVLSAMAPGQYSGFPIQTANGWYIIKAEARRQEQPPGFDTVKLWLTQQLIRNAMGDVVKKAMTGLPQTNYGLMGKDAQTAAAKTTAGAK